MLVSTLFRKRQKNYFIRKKKAYTLVRTIIEKNKYISDTKGEKLALAKKRATSKRKTTKRKTVKRKVSNKKVTTLNNLKSKKKELLLKRKKMINKLKK